MKNGTNGNKGKYMNIVLTFFGYICKIVSISVLLFVLIFIILIFFFSSFLYFYLPQPFLIFVSYNHLSTFRLLSLPVSLSLSLSLYFSLSFSLFLSLLLILTRSVYMSYFLSFFPFLYLSLCPPFCTVYLDGI